MYTNKYASLLINILEDGEFRVVPDNLKIVRK